MCVQVIYTCLQLDHQRQQQSVFQHDVLTMIIVADGPMRAPGYERIDLLRFLVRCCERRLNQALSVLSLSVFSAVY